MDQDEEMAELKAQEARRVRDEAKKCLRHASFQLGKAAYEMDEYLFVVRRLLKCFGCFKHNEDLKFIRA